MVNFSIFFKACWKNIAKVVTDCCPYFSKGQQKMAQPTQADASQENWMMVDDIQPPRKVQKAIAQRFNNIDEGNTVRRASETVEADEDVGLDPDFSHDNDESMSLESASFSSSIQSQQQQHQGVTNLPARNMNATHNRPVRREI